MLEYKIILKGTKEQKIYQMLKKAGWFHGRKVDSTHIVKYYNDRNIILSDKVIAFFEEYYGIASRWDITYIWNFGEHTADFYFDLFPFPQECKVDVRDFMFDDANFLVESQDYKNVKNVSKEYVVMVGLIGYHYPAFVWITKSGKIYCTHDYEDNVRKFDSMIQLILHELSNRDITAVIMQQ